MERHKVLIQGKIVSYLCYHNKYELRIAFYFYLTWNSSTQLYLIKKLKHYFDLRYIYSLQYQHYSYLPVYILVVFFYSKINMINFEKMASFIFDFIEEMTSAFCATVRFFLTTPKMNRLTSKCPLLAAIVSGVVPSFERGFKSFPFSFQWINLHISNWLVLAAWWIGNQPLQGLLDLDGRNSQKYLHQT